MCYAIAELRSPHANSVEWLRPIGDKIRQRGTSFGVSRYVLGSDKDLSIQLPNPVCRHQVRVESEGHPSASFFEKLRFRFWAM
jgi:hypothetical protein